MMSFFNQLSTSRWSFAVILLLAPLLAYSEGNEASLVKAALTYNFAKYTQWPEEKQRVEVALCYFSSVNQASFEVLADKRISDKRIIVKRVGDINDTADCHLIYIDNEKRDKLQRLFIHLNKKSVLTVSDMPGFIQGGGMIEIVNQDGKLRFKINLTQLEKNGIALSSQVLKLATHVKRGQ